MTSGNRSGMYEDANGRVPKMDFNVDVFEIPFVDMLNYLLTEILGTTPRSS